MDHIGIDLHKRESQICLSAEGGEVRVGDDNGVAERLQTPGDPFTLRRGFPQDPASRIRCHRGAIGSPREAWGSRRILELRSEGRSLPTPQISASSHWLRLAGSAMRAPRLANAFMRWSVPEVGTNLGTNSLEGEFRRKQRAENNGGQGRD